MRNIKLTNNEIRALKIILEETNACESGCAYPEMRNSRKSCNMCDFTKAVKNMLNKIENGDIVK